MAKDNSQGMEEYCQKKYDELKDLYKVANTLAFIEE